MATPQTQASRGTTALVLQGGGALGAYQAGVYEALAAAGWSPDWIAGISIGAINAALIAGNPPEARIDKLHRFWDRVSSRLQAPAFVPNGPIRRWFSEVSAGITATTGLPGFFTPRLVPPALSAPGSPEAISIYDTKPLRDTLADLVDFDRINHARAIRFSVGAVNVRTGNFAYFDNRETTITVDHVMASGALPPGFAPVVIEGEAYWDGGIVSNTPLQHVLDHLDGRTNQGDATIFQVDLFPARGALPRTLADAIQREKDIRFSSRTRLNTDLNREIEKLRAAARRLVAKLPAEFQFDPDARLLAAQRNPGAITVLQLINRSEPWESQSKDYEFARATVDGHWAAGKADVEHSLADPRWTDRRGGRSARKSGMMTLDLTDPEHLAQEPVPARAD
ncbi:MAG: patatin-like phospholipase family protein [Novosphingobium sp.]|nr:patatin-like phospholipase family protein [Novosphingobium sp.]